MSELDLSSVPGTVEECKCCFEKTNLVDQFCQKCGFPLKGTNAEQQIFMYRRSFKKLELNGYDKKIKSAGTTLYVLAGIFMLYGLVYFFADSKSNTASAMLITYGLVAIIFLLLGAWSGKKPVASIISGMVLYISLQLISAVSDPTSLFKGIIFKIIIISYLIKGLLSGLEAEKIKKQHNIE